MYGKSAYSRHHRHRTRLVVSKLNAYNRQKTSFKEVGAYLVVLPRADHPRYSLWIYSPLPEKQSIFYIFDLDEDVHETLRISSTLCYYSSRPLFLVEYNAKRMQNRGDDIISFGKYHGHYLHEILQVDPGYLTWIAFKFTPNTQARTFRSNRPDISFRIYRHPATKSPTTVYRTLSRQRGRKSRESDSNHFQCPSGRRSL